MFGGWNKAAGSNSTQTSNTQAQPITFNKGSGNNSSIMTPKGNKAESVLSSGSKESSRAMSIAFNSDNISEIDKYDKFLVAVFILILF